MAPLATLLTVTGIGLLLLPPYPLKGFRYPVGWDAAFYVWRAKAVTVDGLARIGYDGTVTVHQALAEIMPPPEAARVSAEYLRTLAAFD